MTVLSLTRNPDGALTFHNEIPLGDNFGRYIITDPADANSFGRVFRRGTQIRDGKAGSEVSILGNMAKGPKCGWKLEKAAAKEGFLRIAGCDEVGRGPMFGPVVAAAVIFPPGCRLTGLNDSKQLCANKRNELDAVIRAKALAFAIAAVDVETIDRINIRRASLLAMRVAVEQLSLQPDFLLIDGCDTIDWACPQQSVVQGDGTSYSIAAASVLAKVHRDRLLVELDAVYPGYGLARHKGYCSREHLAALDKLGPTPLHRKNWSPVAQIMLEFSDELELVID